jgi:FkbM family methyltransferase
MRYFIDLGTHIGSTLDKIISSPIKFDKYIGFEAIPYFYNNLLIKFKDNMKVSIINKCASTKDEKNVKFYIDHYYSVKRNEFGDGSSLLSNKKMKSENKEFIYVETINFSKYILDNFKIDDYIELKINIEGEEYNLLEDMMKTRSITYINKIYCDWHYDRMRGSKKDKLEYKKRHFDIISRVNSFGFELTGISKRDVFKRDKCK